MINRDDVRAFIAIGLPEDLKSALREFEQKLRGPKSRCAKWVDPASIHLTLKSLGNVNSRVIEDIKKGLEVEVSSTHAFSLRTAETGCFPNVRRPRVFWIGLDGDIDVLLNLQSRIDQSTAKLGFPRENCPFQAHLTLARVRDDCGVAEREAFASLVSGVKFEPNKTIHVNAVSLIRSQLRPEGAVYTALAEYRMS